MQWDRETDVVVVGCGSAGGMAAIAAHDAGASVLIIEKMPEEGGTSRSSGGRMRIVLDPEKAVDYIYRLCEGATPREMIEVYVYEGMNIPEWIRQLGGEIEETGDAPQTYPRHVDPKIPGAESISPHRHKVGGPIRKKGYEDDVGGGGANLMTLLINNITKRKIETLLETRASRLLTREGSEVIGVEAENRGKKLRVKAKRGVILTCGGFSANPEMLRDYIGQDYYINYCNPGNTGDGIKMAMEIGADLWHMNAIVVGFGYKVPDYDYPIVHRVSGPGFLYVDRNGKRFMNETGVDSHHMWSSVNYWDLRSVDYPRVPAFVILDANTFRAGPIATTVRAKISDFYSWSKDNEPELKRGWIIEANTIEHLAQKLDMRPDVLQETVSRYNMFCIIGYDSEFNRDLETLEPVIRPPFYAAKIFPCILNTHGGPRRNTRAQVLNVSGMPIPRLFSAGEFGSLWNRYYIGAGDIRENIVFGRIAGQNTAGERPWE